LRITNDSILILQSSHVDRLTGHVALVLADHQRATATPNHHHVVYSLKNDYDVVDCAGKLAVLYLKMIVKLELFSQQNMKETKVT